MSILFHSSSPLSKPSSSSSSQHAAQVPSKPQSLPFNNVFPRKISATLTTVIDTNDTVFKIPTWRSSKYDLVTRHLKLYDAFCYFKRMVGKGHKPDLYDATQLMYDLSKACKMRKAIWVMEMIVKSGGTPDSSSYTFLVSCLCRGGKVGGAMQLVETMEAYGIEKNTAVYNSIIKGLCEQESLNKSLEFMERAMRKGFVPDEFTCAILVRACSKERGVDEARRLVDGVAANRGTVNVACYNVILTGLCNNDRFDEAIRLVRDLPAMGFRPDVLTYNILLGSLCYKGHWLEANEVLHEMVGNDCSPTVFTYNHLIGSLAFHGKTEQALAVLDSLLLNNQCKLNTDSYNPIIERLCKERKVDDVVKRLDEMIRRRCFPNDATYSAIAVLCEEWCVQESFSVIQSLRDKRGFLSVYDFYQNVISSLSRKGKTYVAFRFLYEMTTRGFTPNSFTYSSLIRGLCKEDMVGTAVGVLMVLEEENVYEPIVDNFNALALGLCKCGRTDLSFDVFEWMIETGCMPNQTTYSNLVEGIIREGEKDLGVAVLKELHSRGVVTQSIMEQLAMQFDLLI